MAEGTITAVCGELTMNGYQELSKRTLKQTGVAEKNLLVAALGFVNEAAEAGEHIKKWAGHGHDLDRDKMAKEIGDALWYAAALCTLLDLKLADVGQTNVDKLKKRFPEGFTSEASKNRLDIATYDGTLGGGGI